MTELTDAAAPAVWTFADMSDPGELVLDHTRLSGFFFYIGGQTPHVWTPLQVFRQACRYAVPIWVGSALSGGYQQGIRDGLAALDALVGYHVTPNTRVVLDMETWVNFEYTKGFRDSIASHGWWTVLYGSASTVFENYIPGGGVWVADWTGHPHQYPGDHVWATQYEDAVMAKAPYDVSEVESVAFVWDRSQPAIPKPQLMAVTHQGAVLTDSTTVPWH